ncbi:MAG: hypothetical protein IJS29_10595 [Selenomonadaceae bacterium]|nr:hypothetical protein [Selenomonadaceae bacterium]
MDAFALLDGGTGDDSIYSKNIIESTINGGDGNDTLVMGGYSSYSTFNGGKGDDIISINGGLNRVIQYVEGDGNDTIFGGSSFDSIQILGSGYIASTVGNDIITVDNGSILVKDAVDKYINIVGRKINTTPYWKLNGTTATFGTSTETLITVTGVKSLDGLTLKDKVVTIAASSLVDGEVKIIGDGYTLEIVDDIIPAGISVKKNLLTASTKFQNDKIDLANYSDVTKINASAVKQSLTITGNDLANSIKGGKQRR